MGSSRLRDIVVDCANPAALAAFWAEVLGYQLRQPDSPDATSVLIEPPDSGPRVWFEKVPEPKTTKNRVHLDVNLTSDDQIEQFVALGARILMPRGTVPDQRWTIMADPEGNEFCVFTPDAQ